jgi:peptidoglycan hydrolase CwlO-like protein
MSQPQRLPHPYNVPAKHTSGAEPPDPVERLHELNIELTRRQSQQTHITKQVTDLQTDITDLTQSVTDMKTILTAYGGQVKSLEARRHSLEYFYDQKKTMTLAAIGDKKGPIDKLIAEFDEDLERMQGQINELIERVATATHESKRAAAAQTERQAEYDAVKAYKDDISNQLTALETLRTQITAADDATDIASMYFLVCEFHDLLGSTEIISQHHLALDLRRRLGDLEAAKENARAKSAELSGLQTELTGKQAELATKQAGRQQQLLAAIQALYPVQPQPAPAAAAAAGAAAGGQAAPAAPAAGQPAAPAGGAAPAPPAQGQNR